MISRSSKRPRNRRLGRATSADYVLEVTTRSSSAKRRRRLRILSWCVKLVLLAAAGTGAYYGVQAGLNRFFFTNPDYTLRTLTFDLDGIMTREEAVETTGLQEGSNIFAVDLSAVEASLRRISMVRQVTIERILPDTISLRLEAREPIAWVAAPGETGDPSSSPDSLLVDASGTLIKPRQIHPEYLHLPVIYGVAGDGISEGNIPEHEGLHEALALIETVAAAPDLLLHIRSIDASKGYRLDVVNDENAHIVFSSSNYPDQLARLQKLLVHCTESGRQLETVNLMVRRNTPVTFVMAAAATPPPVSAPKTGRGR